MLRLTGAVSLRLRSARALPPQVLTGPVGGVPAPRPRHPLASVRPRDRRHPDRPRGRRPGRGPRGAPCAPRARSRADPAPADARAADRHARRRPGQVRAHVWTFAVTAAAGWYAAFARGCGGARCSPARGDHQLDRLLRCALRSLGDRAPRLFLIVGIALAAAASRLDREGDVGHRDRDPAGRPASPRHHRALLVFGEAVRAPSPRPSGASRT